MWVLLSFHQRVSVQSIVTNGWNLKYYKLCLKKMPIWIRARTDLIFLKIPCLLPGGASAAGCRPGWLQCVGKQKLELFCVLGWHSLHFRNEKFLCSSLWKSEIPSQLSSWDGQACMCLFSRSCWILNLQFMCSGRWPHQQKDRLWHFGGLVMQSNPSFLLQKRQYVLSISI